VALLRPTPQSEVANQEIELLVQVGLEVEAFDVALLHATLLLGFEVHLAVVLDAGVRAAGHH